MSHKQSNSNRDRFHKQELKVIDNCLPCCGRNGNMLFEIQVINEAGQVVQSAKVQRRSKIRFTDNDISFTVGQRGDTVLVVGS